MGTIYTPLGFDPVLLESIFLSRQLTDAVRAGARIGSSQDDPAVTAPWQIPKAARPIEAKLADLRGIDNFIDLGAKSVVNSGGDGDSRNLFALYNALTSLRTLAQYASDDRTSLSSLGRIDGRFQSGLIEIAAFLKTATFERTEVLYGEASDKITSRAALGRAEKDYIGARVHVGDRDAVLSRLNGTEQFTITLKKGLNTDVINIDLADMVDPLTLDNVALHINKQIAAVVEGDLSERYRTRFTVTEKDGGFAFKIRGFAEETINLTAASAPALIIAGTFKASGEDTLDNGIVTQIGDLGTADPTQITKTQIDALASDQPPPSEVENEDGTTTTADPILAASQALATAVDSGGNIYVVGTTSGDFDGQYNSSTVQDVYLRKYDSAGNLLFERLLGAQEDASAFAIAIDANDNVFIAGRTSENLTPEAVIDSEDTFVTKFSSTGSEIFTHQIQAVAEDAGVSLTIDAAGDVIVAGHVTGLIDASATLTGTQDAFIRKLDGTDGSVVYTQQFGGPGSNEAYDIEIASDGNILVLARYNGFARLIKLDAADPTNEIFNVTLGDLQGGAATGLTVSGGEVYVTGYSVNAAFGGGTVTQAHSGGTDGFVVRVDDAGNSASINYTAFVGAGGEDRATDVVTDGTSVYVLGTTDSAIGAETEIGSTDSFVVKFDAATGAQVWDHQFGSSLGATSANGIALSTQGESSLTALGMPQGDINTVQDRTITSQTSVRDGYSFYLSFNGGDPKKFTIRDGDTFADLAKRINRLNFRYVDASSLFSSDSGNQLQLKAINGARIDIIAGPEGKDALIGLGLDETKIFDDGVVVVEDDEDDDEDKKTDDTILSKTYGLELNQLLHLLDKKSAAFAITQIDNATAILQKAFRALNPDPVIEALKAKSKFNGPVPAHLQAQLANYQAGLLRLTAGGSAESVIL